VHVVESKEQPELTQLMELNGMARNFLSPIFPIGPSFGSRSVRIRRKFAFIRVHSRFDSRPWVVTLSVRRTPC